MALQGKRTRALWPALSLVLAFTQPLAAETTLRYVGGFHIYGQPQASCGAGDLLFVACDYGGLHIFDVSGPSPLRWIAMLDRPDWHPISVAASGNRVYFGLYQHGFAVAGVTDPQHPRLLGQYGDYYSPGTVWDLAASGNHLYCLASSDLGSAFLIYDVSDAANPSQLASLGLSGTCLELSGNLVYVGADDRLTVVDVSSPSRPSILGSLRLPAAVYDVAAAGNVVFGITSDGMVYAADFSAPAHPEPLDTLRVGTWGASVETFGNWLVAADQDSGITVFDLSQPGKITKTARLPNLTGQLFALDNRVYISAGRKGLYVLDPAQNFDPVDRFLFGQKAYDLDVLSSTVYLADGHGGLWILDVSDAASPNTLGVFPTEGEASAVYVSYLYAYLLDSPYALRVLDIADPSTPKQMGEYALSY